MKGIIEIPIDIVVRKTWIDATLVVATADFVDGKCKGLELQCYNVDEALKGGLL